MIRCEKALAFVGVVCFITSGLAAPEEKDSDFVKAMRDLAQQLIAKAGGKDSLSKERVAVAPFGGKGSW